MKGGKELFLELFTAVRKWHKLNGNIWADPIASSFICQMVIHSNPLFSFSQPFAVGCQKNKIAKRKKMSKNCRINATCHKQAFRADIYWHICFLAHMVWLEQCISSWYLNNNYINGIIAWLNTHGIIPELCTWIYWNRHVKNKSQLPL